MLVGARTQGGAPASLCAGLELNGPFGPWGGGRCREREWVFDVGSFFRWWEIGRRGPIGRIRDGKNGKGISDFRSRIQSLDVGQRRNPFGVDWFDGSTWGLEDNPGFVGGSPLAFEGEGIDLLEKS